MSSPPSLYNEKTLKGSEQDSEVGNEFTIRELGAGAASNSTGILGRMWAVVKAIDKYGIEVRGIERVLPQEKVPPTSRDWWDNLWLWLAANCTISSLALGTLGPSTFGLSGKVSILAVIFFNLLSTFPVAFFSVFGAKLGLRQMTITRFSFGYWVALFPVVLNIIACLGWSTINTIVGAQALRAVSTTHQIPTAVAIIIISILSFLAPFFGYKVVHTYERYAWIPIAIIFLIMLGFSAKYMDLGSVTSDEDVTGSVLSFGAAIFGFGVGWCSYAADYTVHMSVDSSSTAIFLLNFLGLNIPLILVESLGAGLATVTREDWQTAFTDGGVGGLIGASLSPAKGFGKFCLVLTALSIVANSGTVVYIVLSIVGASHFESWLDTLLVILSYWLSIYCAILAEEHFIFRKGKWSNYNVDDYMDHTRLPLGVAAAVSLGVGIMGAVLGMAQTWYIGVIGAKSARKVGDPAFGGDLGFELSLGFTAITYPILRAIEIHFESPKRRGPARIQPYRTFC
ncbi:hypothetical protein Clacol_003378 [Clathrus columnatus]|uniref:Purine-cytosine permease n=1 Tax=Clathrus columnatus TaxID=1419009 RepID=A0AAV5A9C8_9AGAM|nr:hypothetical protein Clacol_003378 [Clathrus columnatus]